MKTKKNNNSYILSNISKNPSEILKYKENNIKLIKHSKKSKINSLSLSLSTRRDKVNDLSKKSSERKIKEKIPINNNLKLKNKPKNNNKKFIKKDDDNQNILKEKINSLKNSLDNLTNMKKQNKKTKKILMDNINYNLSNFSKEKNEKNKTQFLSNININNLDTLNNNNNNLIESPKNKINNTESIMIDENISFFSPKKNLKMNTFLKNHKTNNKNQQNNEKDINQNLNKYMRCSTAFKRMNYHSLIKNPNYISSSNDQISTDTNFVNNKNYSLINNTATDIVNFNPMKKKSTNFHSLLHHNIKKKMEEFENKIAEQQQQNYPLLLLRSDKKSKSNREVKNFHFHYQDYLKKNKTKSEDEKQGLNSFFDGRKCQFYTHSDGNLKYNNFKTILTSPKKKKTHLNYNLLSLKENLNPLNIEIDNNLITHQKNSKNKIIKNFKKQLSRIPEISLIQKKKRKFTSSIVLFESKIEQLKGMKEIIEHKNENSKRKKNLTPILKKGYKTFKKLIDKIEKKIIEIDASFSNSSNTDKSERRSTLRSNNTFNFNEFRTNSVRLSIREIQFKINKDIIDVKKGKLIEFLSNNIKNYDENIDLEKINFVDKIISNIIQIVYKNVNNIKKRNSLINKKNDKYQKECDKYFKEINVKSLNKFEIGIIKFINFKNKIIQNIIPFYYNQIILKNHFRINLYDQIMKGRYLETDLGNKEILSDLDNILINFDKNQKKTIKSLKRSNYHINILNHPKFTNISLQFYNNFLILDGKEIEKIDNYEYEEYNKGIYLTFNRKRYYHDRIVRYNNTYNNQFEKANSSSLFHPSHYMKPRNSIKYNKARLSLKNTYFKNIIVNNLKYDENNKNKILKKEFFKRKRNSFENELIFQRKRKNKKKTNLTIRKKQKTLYTSPVTLSKENNIIHGGNFSLRGYDKEMNLFKTMKIKNDLLKKCINYKETLFLYIKHSDYHNFKKLFERIKPNPNIFDNEGNSLLNLAVQCDSKKIVYYLLCKGADPNTQNNKLNTPLHYALIYKNFEISDLLIKYGANENLKNGDGLTAWQCLNYDDSLI